MALVMGITIPAGWDIVYNKTLKMYDISVMCNVGKNASWMSRAKKLSLREVTYLFQIAYAWSQMSQDTKDQWNYASNVIGMHNYNLYVQDKSYRLKYGIAGNAEPSLFHQYLVGHINITSPATSAKIVQYNPHKIYFPCSVGLSYKTNLTATDTGAYAKIRHKWMKYNFGQNFEIENDIEIPLISGWDTQKIWIPYQSGQKGKWKIEIDLYNVTGDIWIDNIIVEYNGQIQLNDPYCEDVVKWWQGENIGDGVTFETIYPTGGAI